MHYHWLNKQNNDKLTIFFTGWSFDYKPFEFLDCGNFDLLIFFDYNNLDLINIPQYKEYFLITWSMGVFVAYQLRDKLPNFTKKIAINGTPFAVNDEYGIPLKPFLLTLKHAKIGLESKFYQNIFNKSEELEKYLQTSVERSIENRVEELQSIYNKIKITEETYKHYYDKALISINDKIIPPKNQLNFWQTYSTDFEILDSGHFPYYNFKSWNEMLCK